MKRQFSGSVHRETISSTRKKQFNEMTVCFVPEIISKTNRSSISLDLRRKDSQTTTTNDRYIKQAMPELAITSTLAVDDNSLNQMQLRQNKIIKAY